MAPTKEGRSIRLNNGKWMPLVGLGCWQSKENEVGLAVEEALTSGYRHIDTAYNYLNEEHVGKGIKGWMSKTGGKREDLFVVTKLPGHGMTPEGVEKFLKKSLASLGLDYIDLYLIHSPVGFQYRNDMDIFPMGKDGKLLIDPATDLIATWKAMEEQVDAGLTKSIGISNFDVRQMRKLLATSRIPPAVHQIELHVYYQRKSMVEFCNAKNIVVTAYAPLGSPSRAGSVVTKDSKEIPKLLEDPVVQLVADNHGVTTAQVLIRFIIQSGITTIPKSVTPARIKKNIDVFGFELSTVEMKAIQSLDRGSAGQSFSLLYFPGIQDHPECPHWE